MLQLVNFWKGKIGGWRGGVDIWDVLCRCHRLRCHRFHAYAEGATCWQIDHIIVPQFGYFDCVHTVLNLHRMHPTCIIKKKQKGCLCQLMWFDCLEYPSHVIPQIKSDMWHVKQGLCKEWLPEPDRTNGPLATENTTVWCGQRDTREKEGDWKKGQKQSDTGEREGGMGRTGRKLARGDGDKNDMQKVKRKP